MTSTIGPPRDDDLEERAGEAERRLLLTLDVLAQRRRHIRASFQRARETVESGVAFFSMIALASVAMLGVFFLTRRRAPRWRRR